VAGATYAIAVIVLVGLGMFRDLKLKQRLLFFPLIALVGTGLAKTGSRSAVLILAMGIAVLIFQGRVFGSRTKRVALLGAIGIILAGVAWQIPIVIERFQKVSSSAELQQQEGRVRMAPVLWEMFLRSPIYGSGPDEYRFELTRRAMPYHFRDQRMITAHNLVLMLLVETGIIGFLLFACGVKPALVGAWRTRLKPCGSLPLALIVTLIIAGATVSQPAHQLVFWFAMAYALAGSS
jgi:O-antigen ligase